MRKLRKINKFDWFIYNIFRMWWNPILRDNKRISIALAREMNSYWSQTNKLSHHVPVKNHNHDLIIDEEVVFSEDGEPQPRGTIFLECISDDLCSFILRDYEIIDYIKGLLGYTYDE